MDDIIKTYQKAVQAFMMQAAVICSWMTSFSPICVTRNTVPIKPLSDRTQTG